MFCEYCRQLFELRQKAERYEPHHKGLGGISSTSTATSSPWRQDQILHKKLEAEERERDRKRTRKPTQNVGDGTQAPWLEPKVSVYEDAEDLFTPRSLWWKIPIFEHSLRNGYGHAPNKDCQVCKMIFSNVSMGLIDVLMKKNGEAENSGSGLAFVYQLKSVLGSEKGVANNEAVLGIWLEFGREREKKLIPLVKLQVLRGVRKF